MSKGQRLGFLAVAVAIAVVAAIVLGSSGGGDDDSDRAATEPAATATATATAEGTATPGAPAEETATPEPTPEAPLLRPGRETEIVVSKGDTVLLRVRSPKADEVHVHGYDILQRVRPGRTVTISFKADITGIFEIELEQAHQPLGTLRVNP
jgi:hypothetical protein